jgi:hypothetical protein
MRVEPTVAARDTVLPPKARESVPATVRPLALAVTAPARRSLPQCEDSDSARRGCRAVASLRRVPRAARGGELDRIRVDRSASEGPDGSWLARIVRSGPRRGRRRQGDAPGRRMGG